MGTKGQKKDRVANAFQVNLCGQILFKKHDLITPVLVWMPKNNLIYLKKNKEFDETEIRNVYNSIKYKSTDNSAQRVNTHKSIQEYSWHLILIKNKSKINSNKIFQPVLQEKCIIEFMGAKKNPRFELATAFTRKDLKLETTSLVESEENILINIYSEYQSGFENLLQLQELPQLQELEAELQSEEGVHQKIETKDQGQENTEYQHVNRYYFYPLDNHLYRLQDVESSLEAAQLLHELVNADKKELDQMGMVPIREEDIQNLLNLSDIPMIILNGIPNFESEKTCIKKILEEEKQWVRILNRLANHSRIVYHEVPKTLPKDPFLENHPKSNPNPTEAFENLADSPFNNTLNPSFANHLDLFDNLLNSPFSNFFTSTPNDKEVSTLLSNPLNQRDAIFSKNEVNQSLESQENNTLKFVHKQYPNGVLIQDAPEKIVEVFQDLKKHFDKRKIAFAAWTSEVEKLKPNLSPTSLIRLQETVEIASLTTRQRNTFGFVVILAISTVSCSRIKDVGDKLGFKNSYEERINTPRIANQCCQLKENSCV